MSYASSLTSDSGRLGRLTSKTALWVGKLSKTRRPEDVARVLATIARAHPPSASVMESHFRGFCMNATQSAVDALWQEAVDTAPLSEELEPTDALREMFWNDNPDDHLLDTDSYEIVKHQLEHDDGFWKCAMPVGYAQVDSVTGDINILCQSKMRDLLHDRYYTQAVAGQDGSRHTERTSMATRWLLDEHKRRYSRIVIDPTMRHPSHEFNMWPGFAAEKLPAVADELVAALIQPFVDHVTEILAAGVAEHASYILDWMALLVQRPERRTQTLLLFYGQQGAGKGMLWDFLREKVLGSKVSMQSADAKRDLFDRFSNGFLYKRLVQLDEVHDIRNFEDDLKNKVTAKELRYEKKNQDTITVANLTNFVVTTNNAITLRVSHDDRRLVLFRCSDAKRCDALYFNNLCDSLATEGAARALFQFLMARDLTRYTNDMCFQKYRPITEFYRESRADSLRPEQLFFSALANYYDAPVKIHVSRLYDSYKAFALEIVDAKQVLHCTTFGRHVSKMVGALVMCHRIGGYKIYMLHPTVLRDLLLQNNMYDPEAFLRERIPLYPPSP